MPCDSEATMFWGRPRWFSLLLVTTQTDRMFQIAAHMAFIGHPLVADPRFSAANFEDDSALVPRVFLHLARVEVEAQEGRSRFTASCELSPDLQVALLRLQTLASDAKVPRLCASQPYPGLVGLVQGQPSFSKESSMLAPEAPSSLRMRCRACKHLEEARCEVLPGGDALSWSLVVLENDSAAEETGKLPRKWGPGMVWTPFELRGTMDHEVESRPLPKEWADQGSRWQWAHDGQRVNGWIDFGDAGALMSRWGAGFWRIPDDRAPGFLVVGINNMAHLLRLIPGTTTFEVLAKRAASVSTSEWQAGSALFQPGADPCCATDRKSVV